jgi:amino acid permease
MMAPLRYVKLRFADGGINASVFSLIQVTLGAGILTFPYAIMENGIVLGTVLILFGGWISWYTGMLLIEAAEHCGRVRYEDIALALYGRKFAIATAILNLLALIGFNMSYIVYVRTYNIIL